LRAHVSAGERRWLGRERKDIMAKNATDPQNPPSSAEDQWFSKESAETMPQHQQIISPARAIEECVARLGTAASPAEIQAALKCLGMDVPQDVIERVCATLPPVGNVGPVPAPENLVRTEAEPVPPPQSLEGSLKKP
jgi:hypothetical protein